MLEENSKKVKEIKIETPKMNLGGIDEKVAALKKTTKEIDEACEKIKSVDTSEILGR